MTGYVLHPVRVLIVDDSAIMRHLMRGILEELGIRLIADAATPVEAWNRLHAFRPDIMLCDWELKSGTGLAFVQWLRGAADSPDRFLPVILVTGHTEVSRVLRARDAGVTEYLAKPFTARDLYARIRALIESSRTFVDTETFFGPDRRRDGRVGAEPWGGLERRSSGPVEMIRLSPSDQPRPAALSGRAPNNGPDHDGGPVGA